MILAYTNILSTCSEVASSISVWNVRSGWAWFSDNQIAFNCKLTKENGRYFNLKKKKHGVEFHKIDDEKFLNN